MRTTRVVTISPTHPLPEVIQEAAVILRQGGTVAFPTETVYGLGADAMNPHAVRKVFEAKGRPSDNPLIVHIADEEQLSEFAEEIPPIAKQLISKFWPGPLTLVLKAAAIVPEEVTAGLETVAVRMPDHNVALQLIRELGSGIVGPSANASGRPSPTQAQHVLDDLKGKVDMILDAGTTMIGLESTV
ncbi:MAG: threonylcarbamoyl-AMP synthase, partial [Ignavibacteriales bacterium]|nr:threonylcarbamoyl-AMP synthase [Ignavibacteriales bacterium]